MNKLFVTLVFLLVLASPAQAVELVNPDGTRAEPFQTWADNARVPLPSGRITVYPNLNRCVGVTQEIAGCTVAGAGAINLRWDCTRLKRLHVKRLCRAVFWHELGHHVALELPPSSLQEIAAITGVEWDAVSAVGLHTHEVFADSYMLCQFGREQTGIYAKFVVGEIWQRQRICQLLRR